MGVSKVKLNISGEELSQSIPKTSIVKKMPGVNMFDKSAVIDGLYVGTNLQLVDSISSKISGLIDVEGMKVCYLQGSVFSPTAKFIDDQGADLEPVDRQGDPLLTNNLTRDTVFFIPERAKYLQLTVVLSGNGNIDQLMIFEGFSPRKYENYEAHYEVIDDSLSANVVTSENLFTKDSVNLFDKDAVIEGFYISSSSGALSVNETSAVSAPKSVSPDTYYNISGKTTVQQEIVFYNSNGDKLKPYALDGTERPNFTMESNNGGLKSPPGSVAD